MKHLIIISLVLFALGNCEAQLVANAGEDLHICDFIPEDPILLGGETTADFGAPPYQYTWFIEPIQIAPWSNLPYFYTEDLINDSTVANPSLLDVGLINEGLTVYLTVTDSFGDTAEDSITLTHSEFVNHLGALFFEINVGDSVFLSESPNVSSNFETESVLWSPGSSLSTDTLYNDFWAFPTENTSYSVTITDEFGCEANGGGFIHIFVGPNSVEEEELTDLILYPNPSNGVIMFKQDMSSWTEPFEIYDMNGQLISSIRLHLSQLDVSLLSSGEYILFSQKGEQIIRETFYLD